MGRQLPYIMTIGPDENAPGHGGVIVILRHGEFHYSFVDLLHHPKEVRVTRTPEGIRPIETNLPVCYGYDPELKAGFTEFLINNRELVFDRLWEWMRDHDQKPPLPTYLIFGVSGA